MPPCKRLEADDLAESDGLLRLVMQEQVATVGCAAQVGLQFAPLAQARAELFLEETDGAAHFRLRLIERGVGVGNQRRRVGAVGRIDRHAHAQADLDLVAVDVEILFECLDHALANN